ncbi:hypothetical protein M409DRAFT_66430 [Zasmidium cellare ATCC 36951]|uniref:Methyltransferase n=1 Tax=Zasmidium cellare ATCC 36951 TaxID=1080233 RepID=A0A6A6CN55_ZASCE|nr:uncharacterized protein M409DRAFT_66430 [Zasmidium cellare ATCC 36951]KAF2166886.1 hypothetical protein M409DRAFT_66430 [Zasmidium cellare ATCC 36951]
MASTIEDSTADAVKTIVNYYQPPADGGPPDYYVVRTAAARKRPMDSRRVKIFDLRGREHEFNLDTNGFQLVRHSSREKTFDDEERVKAVYYPEIERLMKEHTGATHAYVFSHVVRRHSREEELKALQKARNDDDMINLESPAMFAHIDQSYDGASIVLDSVIDSAVSIVNAWRPLKPITREPLAVCDAATVSESDLREIILRIRDDYNNDRPPQYAVRNQKIWQVAANPQHRWYLPKRQTPEEVLLIKCFDSKKDVARRAPHSAVQMPGDHGPPRESVEVRCFLFWEDEKKTGQRPRL